MIYKALVKYGYSSFKLEILENCEPNILIEREQYYLDLLNPEYNILKKAGSLLGFRHSEASRELMSFVWGSRMTRPSSKRRRARAPSRS